MKSGGSSRPMSGRAVLLLQPSSEEGAATAAQGLVSGFGLV